MHIIKVWDSVEKFLFQNNFLIHVLPPSNVYHCLSLMQFVDTPFISSSVTEQIYFYSLLKSIVGGSLTYLIGIKSVFAQNFEKLSPHEMKQILLREVRLSPHEVRLMLTRHQSDSSLIDIYFGGENVQCFTAEMRSHCSTYFCTQFELIHLTIQIH